MDVSQILPVLAVLLLKHSDLGAFISVLTCDWLIKMFSVFLDSLVNCSAKKSQ